MSPKRNIPVWAGCYAPFRLVIADSDEWSYSLDEINERLYDKTKLFRLTLNVDIGAAPWSVIVLFDGTLLLPICDEFPKNTARSIFNKHLTNMLLSGLVVQEIAPDDISEGSLNWWGYHRHYSPRGRYTKLSQLLRTGRADVDDLVTLLDPPNISKADYQKRHHIGQSLSRVLPENLITVLLPSCTAYTEEKWERALILGWTSVELIVDKLWTERIIRGSRIDGVNQKRRKQFLKDTRTWSSSSRIEMIWRQGLISDEIYSLVDAARAARNSFIHSATNCEPDQARSAIEATMLLIEGIAHGEKIPFDAKSLIESLDESTTHFSLPIQDESGQLLAEPLCWRPLDPAPGFEDWGERPFEKNPDYQITPTAEITDG